MHRAPTVAGLVLALYAGAVSASTDSSSDDQAPHLRPLNPEARQLLTDGIARSPTIRALVAELDRSDLAVFIVAKPFMAVRSGATQFVSAAAGWRYLLVSINSRNLRDDLIRSLGHELEHAVEVARAPEVKSDASFEAFYERVGMPSRGSHRYETEGARKVEALVRLDLTHGNASARERGAGASGG